MKYITILIIAILCCSCLYSQNNVLNRINNSEERMPFTTGYIDQLGDTIIPIGKYMYCHTIEFDKLAIVTINKEKGHCAIDRSENILFEIPSFDGGPDTFNDGLIRIKVNGKYGYANESGRIVIKPQFDSSRPFKEGIAAVCLGGFLQKSGEYEKHVNGKWGFINTSGDFIIQPKFDMAHSFRNGKATVKANNETYKVDIYGKKVRSSNP